MNNKLKLLVALLAPLVVGYVGSIFTTPTIPVWYATLAKPALNPPAWVFGPVWTLLYLLMGIAFYLVWHNHTDILKNTRIDRVRRWGMGLWAVQLMLNLGWSVIFFKNHNIGGALIEIIFLWAAILTTIILFRKVSKKAAWLMLPYLVWVTFAAYLNYSIFVLN